MSDDTKIFLATEEQLFEIEAQFAEMYMHFNNSNGLTYLPKGGFERWCKNYTRSRNISRVVYFAELDGQIAGFIEGQILINPQAVNPEKCGHITHLFVSQDFRRRSIASRLHHEVQKWFGEKFVQAETLDIVHNNRGAGAFWASRGFQPLFAKYRRSID